MIPIMIERGPGIWKQIAGLFLFFCFHNDKKKKPLLILKREAITMVREFYPLQLRVLHQQMGLFLLVLFGFWFMHPSVSLAVGVNQAWVTRYSGPGGGVDMFQKGFQKVLTDSQGNVYIAGSFINASGDFDFATVKYDSKGNQLWASIYDTGMGVNDKTVDMTLDSLGNIYITGNSSGDISTIKYDPNGNQLWKTVYIGYNGPASVSAMVTDGAYIYITGTVCNDWNCSTSNYLTVKYYASSGAQRWSVIDSTSSGNATSLALDFSSNVYVAGTSGIVKYNDFGGRIWAVSSNLGNPTQIGLDSGENVYLATNGFNSQGNYDQIVTKYDPNGNQLWQSRYDSGTWDVVSDMKVDGSGNTYIAGHSCAPPDCVTSNYMFYPVTTKFDTNGTLLWAAKYENGFNGIWPHLALDLKGNVFTTSISGNGLNDDYATIMYDSNGNQVWILRYDNGGNDGARSISLDSSGNIYVTGYSFNGLNYDFATVKYNQTYSLTVTTTGTGNGTVTTSPAGVNCGAICSASFVSGTAVTLTATPAAGYSFTGWSGDCTGTGASTTVNMIVDKRCAASFVANVPSGAAPDLVITAVSFNPNSVTRPGSITINFTITNQGGTFTSPTRFYIGAYLSTDNIISTTDIYCGKFQMPAMKGGTSYSGSMTCAVGSSVSAGTYYVGAYADFNNGVVESNENNNGLAASGTLQVK